MHRPQSLACLAVVSICLLVLIGLGQVRFVQTVSATGPRPKATPTPKPSATPKATATPTPTPDFTMAAQKIRLFYLREATKIVAVLTAIAEPETSKLHGLIAKNATEDEILLYGSREQRDHAWRIIAALDLPRAGVNMEMWGVQISSNKPEQMEKVMPAVREQIDSTQRAVRDAYLELQRLTLEKIPDDDPRGNVPESMFRRILVEDLGYKSALDSDRPLSLTDILLRMISAKSPGYAATEIADGMNKWLAERNFLIDPSYAKSSKRQCRTPQARLEKPRPIAFRRFFELRGLQLDGQWRDSGQADGRAFQARSLVLDFAFHYGRLVHQPQRFSAYSLQQSAEALNTRLQMATDALNADIQDVFVAPTLLRIGEIVRCYDDVEYAQVGKVTVAGLSGVSSDVKSKSRNAFDVTPPLTLSGLLEKAKKISDSVAPFDPASNTVGALQLSQVIGLIGAFGDEEAVWREMESGVSVTVTPNVLRNMTSAELKIDLKTGDPQVSGTQEQKVRPISRVSQHEVNTTIYVNALDFFDLSAFVSQATLGGGRGMVPVIGPIWRGLFGEIPVAGKLFSWQKSPKTVYSDSLILTNSFITPTAMGIALLYPTEFPKKCRVFSETDTPQQVELKLKACFEQQEGSIEGYKDYLSQMRLRRY